MDSDTGKLYENNRYCDDNGTDITVYLELGIMETTVNLVGDI